MKIAFYTNSYRPLMYGSATSIENFRSGLEKLGHEVFVFAPKFWGYQQENSRVVEYPSLMYGYKIKYPLPFSWNPLIRKKAKKLELDIVHSHNPFSMGMEAMRLSKAASIPLVFTHHARYDDYSHYILPILPQSIIKKLIRTRVAAYANRCHRVIAPSRSILEYIKKGGITSKIDVLPTGIDWKKFQEFNGGSVRNKYKIKEGQKVILNLGRLDQEKNLGFLCEAVFKVLKQSSNCLFMLVGDGAAVEKIRSRASELGVADKVIFTGLVDQKNVQDYYHAADVFVCASKTETQGMTISEAKAAGLAVVAVDATGIRDQIENQVTGFLTKESEGEFVKVLQMILVDDKKRSQIATSARQSAKEMDYLAQAKKLEQIYTEELGR